MKILITGSSGFVGRYLVKKLAKNHKVVRYDLLLKQDVLNGKLLAQKMKNVDLVIHLAAFISATESWEKPAEYIRNNALGTLSVIQRSIEAGVRKIIFFSSAAVKAKPLTPYAVSKIAAEEIIMLYVNQINSVIVRPENIYGKGQKANYGYVIHNFINAAKSGMSIKIFGRGNQSRDFIYIDDVVNVIEKIIKMNIKSGTIISLGTGKETKIIELAKLVMESVNKKVEINFFKRREEPVKSVADTLVLKDLGVDISKFTTLAQGIKNIL